MSPRPAPVWFSFVLNLVGLPARDAAAWDELGSEFERAIRASMPHVRRPIFEWSVAHDTNARGRFWFYAEAESRTLADVQALAAEIAVSESELARGTARISVRQGDVGYDIAARE